MIVSQKKLENAQVELQIEVPEDRVEVEYRSVLDSIQRNAKIDGFRRGKVPREIIERKFMDMADQEVIENLLRSVYTDAVTEKDLKPVSPPRFDFDKIVRGRPFQFKAVFDVMPEVELGPYSGLSVEERDCKIAEEDIKGEIEALRERNAAVSKKEDDGRVEKADLVKFKIKRIDNVDTDGVDKVDFRDYSIIVGKSKEDHTIDKDILGMKAGEEKEVKVKYPKDYSVKDLAGQTVKYLVRIEEISSMDLPALDDDFAKDLGEHATLEDLKKGIRSNMEEFVRSKVRGEAKNRLLKQVVEGSKFDIPESMVIREMDSVFRRVQERTGYHAQDINQFTSTLGLDPEDFSRQIKEEAAANIKSTLALSEIAKKEELKVPEERYREILSGIAKKNNKSVEDLEKLIGDSGSRESIESELILEAAIDFVYSNATVKKTKPVSLDKFIKGD